MNEKEEEKFQLNNTCWICEKLIDDEKVRDHCHINGKFRGATHWSCNANLQLTKKVPAIFHNLKGYDSPLNFHTLKRFDVKIYVIPNRLENYMAFVINKSLVFNDSVQFMNSVLEKLVKNLSDNDFKYFTVEFGSKDLEFLKEKEAYPYEYMASFKKFSEEKLPEKEFFYSSVRWNNWG